jgi:acyl-CoA reductase-like NAD-dependent aldehyde dehydrogenase
MAGTFSPIVDGQEVGSGSTVPVHFPATGATIAQVRFATVGEVDVALNGLAEAAAGMARLPAWRRSEILRSASGLVRDQRQELVELLVLETGKPLREAEVEVTRAEGTLLLGAEEARRIGGEIVVLDGLPAGESRLGETRAFPLGPVAGITPFNSPFNLACHKAAGAMAAGCPLALKPSPRTPLTTVELGRILLEAGWPPLALAVLPGDDDVGEALVRDPRIRAVAFNGSVPVGWHLRTMAGTKRLVLELGGNGAVIVADDADVDFAARRCVEAGYLLAGQVCASVQRVYVQRDVLPAFLDAAVGYAGQQVIGDPREADTTIGPLITEQEAARVEQMVDEAIEQGAQLVAGGSRDGAYYTPTVLRDATAQMRVITEEVFGPVLSIVAVDRFSEAVEAVNAGPYGMQAGVFSGSLERVYEAYRDLDMAGVIINDVNAWRIDSMPFGGEKASGLGREGPRGLIEAFTYQKLLVLNLRGAT